MYLSQFPDNVIRGNILRDNLFGITVGYDSPDNAIYRNDFVDNKYQAWAYSPCRWDDGARGNYWSDYAGQDRDDDGVGDEL